MRIRAASHLSSLLAGLLLVPAPAQSQAAQGDTLPVDPSVRVGELANGLRYYVRANGQRPDRAELRLVVDAGSVLESEDQRGLAHFLEHMAFNGTERFPKQALVSYLESIGMQFGADLNAYTSFDETVYMLTVPTDTGTALTRGLDILEDWAHAQTLDRAEIDKERGVVVEEWRLGQGAQSRMMDETFPVLFHGSRYAERLPIGDPEVLRAFEPATLERFYRDWYRPELMAVIAVGDFDPAAIEAMIRERFSTIPAREGPDRQAFAVPAHDDPLVSIATDPEATTSVVNVFFKRPAQQVHTVGDYRRSFVESLYDGMLSSRLSEIAQRPDPPFLGAGGGSGGLVRTAEAYTLAAAVPSGGIERGLETVLTEAERVARHGFSASELERQKADLLRSYEVAYNERDKTESGVYAAEYVRAFLEDEAIPGIAYEFELAKQILPGIALDELNAHARETMQGSMVIAVQAPERVDVPVPAEEVLLALFETVQAKDIGPWEDIVAEGPLVDDPPAPGRVVGESRHEEVGVVEWSLSNGARVFLKSTDFKNDEVLFRGFSPGGTSLAPDAVELSARMAVQAVGQGGVGDMSVIELQKALAGKAVGVAPLIGEREEGINGRAAPSDLETMLQLVHLYFTAPRADEEAFQSLRTRFQAQLANRDANPATAFGDTLTLTMSQHHPRRQPLTAQKLDDWELDESVDFYRERFADADDFTFVFVGNVDPNSLRPLVEQWLASLPALPRVDEPRDLGIRPPTGVVEKVVRKGIEPKSQTQIIFTGPFDYERRDRHILASLSAVLDMRLRDVLREDLGGTYGVQVGQSSFDEPEESYSFSVAFSADPGRLEELTRAVFEEIEKLQAEPVDAETLAKVKEGQRRSWEDSQTQNGFWLSQIAFTAENEEDFAGIPDYPQLVDALTAEDIRAAARQYLRRDNYVRVSLYPERTD